MITEVENELFKEQKKSQTMAAPVNMYQVELVADDIDQSLSDKIRLHCTYVNTPAFMPNYEAEITCNPEIQLKFTEFEDYSKYAYFLSKITALHKNGKENVSLPTLKITACNKAGIPVLMWTIPDCEILELSGLEFYKSNVDPVKFIVSLKGKRCDVEMCRAWHKSM